MSNSIKQVKNFIAGKWVQLTDIEKENVYNPATGEIIAEVPLSRKDTVNEAIAAAKKAFESWSQVAVPKRARLMFKYHELLVENWDNLAEIITIENGKSFGEARGEVQRGIECVEHAASAPNLMMGRQLASVATNVESGQYRYPIGVIGGIAPFNFPMMVPCWMFPLAIALGNTFVLKPSEKTPLLCQKLGKLFVEAGFPEGVLNIVNGAKDVVNGLLESPDVLAISFVGSQPIAEYVYKTGTSYRKRVQALAGAKNHTIVLNDANIDSAVDGIIKAAFGSAGERCMATSVAVLQEDIADKFIEKFLEESDNIKIGNGLDKGVFLGPVIREESKIRTIGYIESGIKEGARLLRDGREDVEANGKGFFLGPTIFDNVTTEMKIWQDEIFAPVLSIIRVKDLEEAINITNKSRFANGACLYTSSGKSARTFREKIDPGMLGVNVGVPAPMSFFPFSGWKDSFYGDLHVDGTDGVEFYTRRKVVTANW